MRLKLRVVRHQPLPTVRHGSYCDGGALVECTCSRVTCAPNTIQPSRYASTAGTSGASEMPTQLVLSTSPPVIKVLMSLARIRNNTTVHCRGIVLFKNFVHSILLPMFGHGVSYRQLHVVEITWGFNHRTSSSTQKPNKHRVKQNFYRLTLIFFGIKFNTKVDKTRFYKKGPPVCLPA